MQVELTPDQLDTVIVMAESYREYMQADIEQNPDNNNLETLAHIEDTVETLYQARGDNDDSINP
jgi:hypothetical protein